MKLATIEAQANGNPAIRSCLNELNELGRLIKAGRKALQMYPEELGLGLSVDSLVKRRQLVRKELRQLRAA